MTPLNGRPVDGIEAVSRACKAAKWCKSKATGDGKFSVETWNGGGADPRTVWIEGATPTNKLDRLDDLLDKAGFFDDVQRACKEKKTCRIAIKPNISVATFKEYKYYTDPGLVDHLVNRLNEMGYDDVVVVEADSFRSKPDVIARNIGFKTPVVNLTGEEKAPVDVNGKSINVSKRLLDADFIVSMPIIKNHHTMLISGALKAMYGTIPDRDKYGLYHLEESGLNIQQATVAVNHATPVDFVIGDMIETQDGNEMPSLGWPSPSHFDANLLVAGRDPLAVDKVMERKMGYPENASPIVKEEDDFRGHVPVEQIPIRGGTLDRIPGWKTVDPWYRSAFLLGQSITGMIKKSGINFTLDAVEGVVPRNV